MLKTAYKISQIPHGEYPRPQMQRNSFINLNGEWDFAKCKTNEKANFQTKILVPFSPESEASGVCNGFTLEKDEKLVYRRSFSFKSAFKGGVTYLHFGAVDQECEVFINGNKVGFHRGGYTPFSFDITDFINEGENEIVVEVTDTTEQSHGARGKQSSRRGGIWYTRQSGIWQTVWLECVPKIHIRSLKITPNADKKEVTIFSDCEKNQTISVYDDGKRIYTASFDNKSVTIKYDFTLWSPENPKLYEFIVRTQTGDTIKSYFGVRDFSIKKDERGKKRLCLNGKPYFMNGVLDQGYFPESLLTPPSDEAMQGDLTMLKDMGFNMVRKHIKLEPLRWYYHCDRLGLIVWQDFVNGGGEYKFSHIATFPFLGFKHDDSDYKYFAREDEKGREEFVSSVHETVGALYNSPSIGVWVPFNEGWGQFDSKKITDLVKELDGTRIIDSVSGWHDQGEEKTELKSLHTYYTKLKVPSDSRAVVLSEFGGYSLKTKGHEFDEQKEFGYKKFKTQDDYIRAVKKLFLDKLAPLIEKGLSASVYTQLSDVEEEINGLVTYDRKVIKMKTEEMRSVNAIIKKISEKIK